MTQIEFSQMNVFLAENLALGENIQRQSRKILKSAAWD